MATAIDVIKRALGILRVYSREQPLQAADREIALEYLNDMISHWQTQYGHLWLYQEAVVLLESEKSRYKLGTDRVVDYDELNVTTVATDTTTTALEVSAAGDIAVSDIIGVELDTGAFHWTTVAATTGTAVTLTDAVPSQASAGNTVYTYTEVITRPLQVVQARYADTFSSQGEVPCNTWSRREYFDQPNKQTTGTVTNFYYSPQRGDGLLYVWPTASQNTNVLFITCVRKFNVATNNASVVDVPDEWVLTVSYNLAKEMMDEYGTPMDRQQMIMAKAERLLMENLDFDNPDNGLRLEIDRGY